MRPKRQILAGWAMGIAAIAAGAVAVPAVADKASNQRASVQLQHTAMDFRRLDEPTGSTAAVTRLAELYGPDSAVDGTLERVRFDLSDIDAGTDTLRGTAKTSLTQTRCLAEAVYYEARSESRAGQIAVAQVVTNRVMSKHFPDSICGVVYQGAERSTGCQFSFACDGSTLREPHGRAWDRAQLVASYVMTQAPRSTVGRSTHYHTRAVNPDWSATLEETRTVGSHVFYRFPWRERRTATVSLSSAPPSP